MEFSREKIVRSAAASVALLGVLGVSGCAPGRLRAACLGPETTHQVHYGETLSAIAQGIDGGHHSQPQEVALINAIAAINRLKDPNEVENGTTLKLPSDCHFQRP